jgi:glycosyltransferase involved in cell wall biosynthesis
MNGMRIAMLYTPLTTAGGAERQFCEELRELRVRGHDVRALTFELRDEALLGGGVARRDVTVLANGGGWPGQVRALRAALTRAAPHVLISHTSPELTWIATRRLGLPYVQYHNSPPFYIGEHANPYMVSRRYRRAFPSIRSGAAGYEAFAAPPDLALRARVAAELRAELKHHALRGASAVVVPSQRTARELRLLHGVDGTVVRGCLPASLIERSVTQDAGAHLRSPRERAGAGGPVVLSVCRLEPVKRIDLLLRAFALVRHDVPDAALVIAGTGSDEPRLRAMTRELALDGCVRFAGYVPEEQLWELYAAADVLAAPAMADFIIAPYEAMAMGCRAVWTTEMETDPAIESSGQVFVAAPEETPFARAIVDALRAPAGARADLRSMTWTARAQRVEALIERVTMKAAA